jgi:hypothetical protein
MIVATSPGRATSTSSGGRSSWRRPSSRSPGSTPHRPALPGQALPQRQRTPGLRRTTGLARRHRRTHPDPRHRPRRPAVRHPRRHADLAQHLPHPDLALRRQGQRRRLPRPGPRPAPRPPLLGLNPPTSSPSSNGWGMRRSRPRRSTCTPCPTPTNATSTRSPGFRRVDPEQGKAHATVPEPGSAKDSGRPIPPSARRATHRLRGQRNNKRRR